MNTAGLQLAVDSGTKKTSPAWDFVGCSLTVRSVNVLLMQSCNVGAAGAPASRKTSGRSLCRPLVLRVPQSIDGGLGGHTLQSTRTSGCRRHTSPHRQCISRPRHKHTPSGRPPASGNGASGLNFQLHTPVATFKQSTVVEFVLAVLSQCSIVL